MKCLHKLGISLILIFSLCFFSFPVSAAELIEYDQIIRDSVPPYVGWTGPLSEDWISRATITGISYGDSGPSSPDWTFQYFQTDIGFLERESSTVDYTLPTVIYAPGSSDSSIPVDSIVIDVPFSSIWVSYYNQNQFSSLSINFGLNFFLDSPGEVNITSVSAFYNNLKATVNDVEVGASPYFDVTSPLNFVYSYFPTDRSSFYVFNSTLGSDSNYFFDDLTSVTFTFEFEEPVIIQELDLGEYTHYMGYGVVVPYYPPGTFPDWDNIWPDDDTPFPEVLLPDDNYQVPSSELFNFVNTSDFVVLLLVPCGLVAFGFFVFKILVWK